MDFKSGQKDHKSGQGFQIEAKRFQIRAEITNRGKKDFKSGQGLQIGVGITNWCRTRATNEATKQPSERQHYEKKDTELNNPKK